MLTKKQKYKEKQKRFKQNVPHIFNRQLKAIGKWYCSGCGLVLLNNEATQKRANKPCDSMEEI